MTTSTTGVSWYLLDAQDRVIDVSPDWDEAAQAGGAGAETLRSRVLGQPVTSFLSGDTPRMFLASALQAVRLFNELRQLDYRCDAPELARKMTMRLVPLPDGQVRVEHQLVRAWPLPVPRRFETQARRGSGDLAPQWSRCSICLWLRSPQGHWQAPEALSMSRPLAVDYTVCPRCRAEIELRLRMPGTTVER